MTSWSDQRAAIVPQQILVAPDAADDPMTSRILSRLPEVPVVRLDSGGDPLAESEAGDGDAAARFSKGKRLLLLCRYRGTWLKGCPGTSGHVCCNLFIVNPGEGCPLDCTYCYLQSYLRRNPTVKIYTNSGDLCGAIEDAATASPSRLFRVGTGEVVDSLVWDELTDLSHELVPLFARLPNAILELKSKDDSISNLLALRAEHKGRTVVSWSVNAERITARDERYTASLERRIAAAAAVVEAGYRVGFHFDPLIHFEGWEDGYRDALRRIFAAVDPKRVAWVSLSTLRYRPEMQRTMIERFPESELPFGEQFLASDNKLRYVQPIRLRMLRFMWNELKAVHDGIPVYMCMESGAAWRSLTGGPPAAGAELVELFSRKGRVADGAPAAGAPAAEAPAGIGCASSAGCSKAAPSIGHYSDRI